MTQLYLVNQYNYTMSGEKHGEGYLCLTDNKDIVHKAVNDERKVYTFPQLKEVTKSEIKIS